MSSRRFTVGLSRVSHLSLLAAAVGAGAIVGACGTDNGQKQFGPDFTLDAGSPQGNDGGVVTDDGGGTPEDDGGGSADGGGTGDGGGVDAGSCTSVLAVVSGGASSAFGSIYTQGAWKTSTLTTTVSGNPGADNPAGQSVPAVTFLGSQLLGVVRTSSNALSAVTWSAGAWSSPTAIGAAAARDTPSITTLAGKAHVVFQGTDYKFSHGTFSGGAWDAATDPVGGAAALQSFGPTTPQVAGVGTELVAVFSGDSSTDGGTGGLYDIRYSGSAWSGPTSHPSPLSYFRANPAITALLAGGAMDLVAVYVDTTTRQLQWTGRLVNKTYTAPATVSVTALSDVGVSLAALANGKLALVFWGQDKKPYFTLGTVAGQAVSWSTPAALVSGTNPTLSSPPMVTAGVCGDDAVATYASGGSAMVTRLRGTAWTAPEAIPTVTNALAAAGATH
jgi:hypothetical protein